MMFIKYIKKCYISGLLYVRIKLNFRFYSQALLVIAVMKDLVNRASLGIRVSRVNGGKREHLGLLARKVLKDSEVERVKMERTE
jgi:hypothetical protein